MKKFFASLLVALLVLAALPAIAPAAGLGDLEKRIRQDRIDRAAPSCAGGACGATSCNGGACSGGSSCSGGLLGGSDSGIGGFFQAIFDCFRNLFQGIGSFLKELFGNSGDNGGTTTTTPPAPPTPPTTTAPPTTPTPPPTTAPPSGTPTATPTAPTDTPSGSGALIAKIKSKFGVAIAGSPDEQRLKYAYETLSILPEGFRTRTSQITYHNVGGGIAGYVYIPQTEVHLNLGASKRGTLVHEMTHTWQGGHDDLTNQWAKDFWGRRSAYEGGFRGTGSVSDYGNTNPLEDMAESVMHYVFYPEQMKQTHKSRYDWIKKNVMGGTEYTGNEFTDWQK